jgi:hypothetical protein
MKFKPVIKILILVATICGFSSKTRAQQLASQKPLSAVYPQKIKDWLAANKKNTPSPSSLRDQRNLPSSKPLPRIAAESKMKHPSLNANLPDKEKIKKLPSHSALTVHQLADRRPAGLKPTLRRK